MEKQKAKQAKELTLLKPVEWDAFDAVMDTNSVHCQCRE